MKTIFLAVLCSYCWSLGAYAATITYNEAVSGDLGGSQDGTLSGGIYRWTGNASVLPVMDGNDRDGLRITLDAGAALQRFVVQVDQMVNGFLTPLIVVSLPNGNTRYELVTGTGLYEFDVRVTDSDGPAEIQIFYLDQDLSAGNIDYTITAMVAPVPLPFGGASLLVGLGLLAAWRRIAGSRAVA